MTYSPKTIAYAASLGYAADDLPLITNGCSGGLSWLYALGGRSISVEQCCHRHDIAYQHGGTKADRKAADVRLRECAVEKASGNGWKEIRAWIMYWCVRGCGWHDRFWAGA